MCRSAHGKQRLTDLKTRDGNVWQALPWISRKTPPEQSPQGFRRLLRKQRPVRLALNVHATANLRDHNGQGRAHRVDSRMVFDAHTRAFVIS